MAVDEVAYRRVLAGCAAPLTGLPALRTVDDVFLHLATWPGISRARAALATLKTASASLPLDRAVILASVNEKAGMAAAREALAS